MSNLFIIHMDLILHAMRYVRMRNVLLSSLLSRQIGTVGICVAVSHVAMTICVGATAKLLALKAG